MIYAETAFYGFCIYCRFLTLTKVIFPPEEPTSPVGAPTRKRRPHTMFGAILAWLKSKKTFLKVQSGTGDNLLEEDIREGYVDYCLWSTFRPESIDTDGELDMICLDSGMVLFRENCTPGEALESSYRQAFGTDFDKDDIAVLMEE